MLVSLYHKLAIKNLAASKNLIKATGRRKKAGNFHQPWFTEDLLRDKRRLNRYNRWLTKHTVGKEATIAKIVDFAMVPNVKMIALSNKKTA